MFIEKADKYADAAVKLMKASDDQSTLTAEETLNVELADAWRVAAYMLRRALPNPAVPPAADIEETARSLIYDILDRYNSGESRIALWPIIATAFRARDAEVWNRAADNYRRGFDAAYEKLGATEARAEAAEAQVNWLTGVLELVAEREPIAAAALATKEPTPT